MIATTSLNPYHEVIPAIISRVTLFKLKPIDGADLYNSAMRFILKNYQFELDGKILTRIISLSAQDVRKTFTNIELLFSLYEKAEITIEIVGQVLEANLIHDNSDEHHHNLISALQKSIRYSDVNASLFYLAKLIAVGDLKSLTRRLLIIAYEDVGLGNPNACSRTYTAVMAAGLVGFPEARIMLSNIVVDLALSPKSTAAYQAVDAAFADINLGHGAEVNPNVKKIKNSV